MTTEHNWTSKQLPVDTGDVPPGAIALAVRVFIPLPSGLGGPPPDDMLCRPFRIHNVEHDCEGFGILAVSVGGVFLTNLRDIDVRVNPGDVVVVWVANNGSVQAAFRGRISGVEWNEEGA